MSGLSTLIRKFSEMWECERFLIHTMRLPGEGGVRVGSQEALRMAWESRERRLTWGLRVVRRWGWGWGSPCTSWGLWDSIRLLVPKESERKLTFLSASADVGLEGWRDGGWGRGWNLKAVSNQTSYMKSDFIYKEIAFPLVAKDYMDERHG